MAKSNTRTLLLTLGAIVVALVVMLMSRASRPSDRLVALGQLIDKEAPVFRLPAQAGGEIDLAAERGHVVVFDFWATWCPPCIESMPITHDVVAHFADRGVKLIAVSVDDTAADIARLGESMKLPEHVARAAGTNVAEQYGITMIPSLVVIDARGVVRDAGVISADEIGTWLPAAIEKAMASGAK